MRIQPWDVALRDGRSITVRPLTVRQRIALTNEMADERAKEAERDGRAVALSEKALLECVREARKNALVSSTLALDCYTLRGAMRVVCAATEHGEALGESLDPRALTELALALLGFGDDNDEKPASAEGKTVAP